jgi:hypothetical protein
MIAKIMKNVSKGFFVFSYAFMLTTFSFFNFLFFVFFFYLLLLFFLVAQRNGIPIGQQVCIK